MSYCRWSTDDFACDLYCYEDARGGWTTHVASNRVIGEIPKVGPFPTDAEAATRADWAEQMVAEMKEQHEFLAIAERKDIDLPFAGETFNDPTLETFRERLLTLRAAGYRFPDYVIETVDEEIAEQKMEAMQP